MIESGTTFCSEMIKANLVDQIAFFRSNKIIGNDGLPFVNNLNLKNISDCMNMKVVDYKFFDKSELDSKEKFQRRFKSMHEKYIKNS